ncbi:hypothetical protein NLG97_g3995 [Lecanicillium saksenae]|uniref:Uncharacterized protein n=1 Tax=Lecanicillium saksenae TaxID=468837 RepID=A0ACC1QZ48_9HYPO|nr:hypothetical protein NLG97_g3995 [Lecanicillium saksenae]
MGILLSRDFKNSTDLFPRLGNSGRLHVGHGAVTGTGYVLVRAVGEILSDPSSATVPPATYAKIIINGQHGLSRTNSYLHSSFSGFLYEYDARLRYKVGPQGESRALRQGIIAANLKMVEKAILAGANQNVALDHPLPDVTLPRYCTDLNALGLAVRTKNVTVARLLIEHGGNVTGNIAGAPTPIFIASP